MDDSCGSTMGRAVRGAVVATSVLVGLLVWIHFSGMDGIEGWIGSHTVRTDTVFSPKYSDAAFRTMNVGMRSGAVISALGAPINTLRAADGMERWEYSVSPTNASYFERALLLRDDRVVDVIHQFYFD
jgi:hypothetical protein